MTKRLLAWLILGALTPGLPAAEVITNSAGFAFPSIQDGAGARAIALGSTYVGIDEGGTALLWNPAGLGALSNPEVSENHDAALVGSTQDIAVLGLPMGYNNGLGISLNYENDGTFQGRDDAGLPTGTYSGDAYGGSLGWGFMVPGGVYLGVALKVDEENLADTGLTSVAGDAGLLWNINSKLSLGAAYTNLGPEVEGWQLDQGFRAGLSSYFFKDQTSQWLAAVSTENLADGSNSVHLGLEDTLFQLLSVRAGYAFSVSGADVDTSDLLGWTFGVGVAFRRLSIDYAYVPLADLGAMQRVSLTYSFGCRCLDAPVTTMVPDETLITLNDDDFAAAPGGGEQLTPEAQSHLYQALTVVSGVRGASLKVSGESAYLNHPGGEGNIPDLHELSESRSRLVCSYITEKMPMARVYTDYVHGEERDESASLFEVVLR